MEEEERKMRGKVNFFLEENIKVHVKRNDRMFWNGKILSKKSDDVYIFQEDKLGEMFLFVSDIKDIGEFKSR